jgi:hypothetical protein
MNGPTTTPVYDPSELRKWLHRAAKWWWGVALLLTFAVIMVGGVAVLVPASSDMLVYLAAALSLMSEVAGLRSDQIRGVAQSLHRKLDLCDSFGWPISREEYVDLLAHSPRSVKKRVLNAKPDGPYFASKAAPGPLRALQNVQESAWFSKHLAEWMFVICLSVMIAAVLLSIAALIVTLLNATERSQYSTVARIVTSLLVFLVSLGLSRMIMGYYAFFQGAARVEEKAKRLCETGETTEVDALKVYYEYHLARAAAPIIPEMLYELCRNELNELWAHYRTAVPSSRTPPEVAELKS